MRIRRRYQNLLPPPDLSSPLPPSATAEAAAVAPPFAAAGRATGGKEGEAMVAAAITEAAVAAAHVSGGGCGGEGGRGLHPNRHTTNPTPCLPPNAPTTGAAAAVGAESGDLPPSGPPLPPRDVLFSHGRGREVRKREQGGESGTDIGDTGRRRNTGAHGRGGNATSPNSFGAEAPVGHGGHKMQPSDASAPLAAAGSAMARWRDEEGEFPPKKRRGGYPARGRTLRLQEEDEESVFAEGTETKPRPSKTRSRRTAVSTTTTMVATCTALTSSGTGSPGGAPTAGGAGTGASKRCDDTVVKEEGGDATSAATATLADGNRGVGNGKKRRSPAVLMEGSRCSRVNGRGWRCCQQTLVGYSLCEHHLGKGRLRSVSSVRCNGRARKKEDIDNESAPPPPSLLLQQHDQLLSGDGEDEEERKPGERRGNRIGTVKARSISSLLHQTHHLTQTTRAAPAPLPSPSPIPATGPVTAAVPPPHGKDTAVV